LNLLRSDAAAIVVIILLSAGCTKEAPKRTTESGNVQPEILLVLPGAEDLKYTEDYDGSVSYRLTEAHPAGTTIKGIRSGLEGQGWKPVPDDLMNPGMTNSHDRGWMNYTDGTRNDANVFLWSAAWESTGGDRVESAPAAAVSSVHSVGRRAVRGRYGATSLALLRHCLN
jgi:hypothetical protein